MTVARHGFVSGKVQRVAYRAFVREHAQAAGLVGWARNLADGRVEVWLQGSEEGVNEVAIALRRGPEIARVDSVELTPQSPAELDGFHIA